MSNYLITGTSRGIGLELVKQLLDLPSSEVRRIYAVTRSKSLSALNEVIESSKGRVRNIIIPELANAQSVAKGIAEIESDLQGDGLDVLINNAGTQPWSPGGMKSVSGEQLLDVFNTNVVSVQLVIAAALPLLQKGKGKKVVTM